MCPPVLPDCRAEKGSHCATEPQKAKQEMKRHWAPAGVGAQIPQTGDSGRGQQGPAQSTRQGLMRRHRDLLLGQLLKGMHHGPRGPVFPSLSRRAHPHTLSTILYVTFEMIPTKDALID